MNVVLLAAGEGTRLRPLTLNTPKCLVPINGKPLLHYWLRMLVNRQDIENIFINVHYLKNQVIDYLQRDWLHVSNIKIWEETELLGTAGTLRKNYQELANKETLVIHADNLSVFNFDEFLSCFASRPSGCVGVMMLFKTDLPKECGIVELDKTNRVVAMHEKVANPPGNLANGAVYVFEASVLEHLKNRLYSDISMQVIPDYLGKLIGWENCNYHRDIGTPTSYALACKQFESDF